MIRSENCHVTIDQKNHPNIGLIRIIVQVFAIVSIAGVGNSFVQNKEAINDNLDTITVS